MISVDRLIKDAMQINEEVEIKHENYFVERYGDNIEIKGIDAERMMEIINKYGQNDMTLYLHLCYEGIVEPNLKDKDLWKQYGVKINNPYEIVKKVFKPFEYSAIAQRIDQLSAGEIPSKAEVQEKAKN